MQIPDLFAGNGQSNTNMQEKMTKSRDVPVQCFISILYIIYRLLRCIKSVTRQQQTTVLSQRYIPVTSKYHTVSSVVIKSVHLSLFVPKCLIFVLQWKYELKMIVKHLDKIPPIGYATYLGQQNFWPKILNKVKN